MTVRHWQRSLRHRADDGGGGGGGPTLTALNPNTGSLAAGPVELFLIGTGFEAGMVIQIEGRSFAPADVQPTEAVALLYLDALQMGGVGTHQVQFGHWEGATTNALPFVVTP